MSVSSAFVGATLEVVYAVLDFYVWALVIGAILSWLVAFEVVNPYNRFVHVLGDLLLKITEPALKPIRRILPRMGTVDLSPLVLIFIVFFVQSFIRRLML